MKTIFSCALIIALTFGCASNVVQRQLQEEPNTYKLSHRETSGASLDLARKYYTNGLVSEAFKVALNEYDYTHDLSYLECASSFAKSEIQQMKVAFQEKGDEINDVTNRLAHYWPNDGRIHWAGYVSDTERETVDKAYTLLCSDSVEKYSKDIFLPRTEMLKNNIAAIELRTQDRLTTSGIDDSERLIALKNQTQIQRTTLCQMRTAYISEIFVGPRISLADKLFHLAKVENMTVETCLTGTTHIHPKWMEKVEVMITKDYGVWIAGSYENTRLAFKAFVNELKYGLGPDQYKEYQTTLELLSNNKEGGSDNWWPSPEATK
jgi:hypothetical protein